MNYKKTTLQSVNLFGSAGADLLHKQYVKKDLTHQASLPDDNRALEPPDPIPNSEVKRCIADGSVGSPHVRVGHRQAPFLKAR